MLSLEPATRIASQGIGRASLRRTLYSALHRANDRLAFSRGFVSRTQLSPTVSQLQPSATLQINELSNDLLKQGREVYKFGLGQSPFPVPQRIVESLRDHAAEKDYLPVKGLQALREQVAVNKSKHTGVTYSPNNVIIGPGSKELLFNIQLACDADLILPSPSWVSYSPQASLIGRPTQWLDCSFENRWKLTPEALEKLCFSSSSRQKLLLLNYPSNPTGQTFTDDELQALADVARKYNIIVLSDEIYGRVDFDGRYQSISRYYPEGTVVFEGLSKWAGAGGWRLGLCLLPETLAHVGNAIAAIASETFTSVSAPIQYAAVCAYEDHEDIDEYVRSSARILQVVGNYVCDGLEAIGARVHRPQGGFYVLPDFTNAPFIQQLNPANSIDLTTKVLEQTGVAFLGGSHFGRPAHEMTARIAFVDFDGGKALERVEELPAYDHNEGISATQSAWLETVCPNVHKAVRALTSAYV